MGGLAVYSVLCLGDWGGLSLIPSSALASVAQGDERLISAACSAPGHNQTSCANCICCSAYRSASSFPLSVILPSACSYAAVGGRVGLGRVELAWSAASCAWRGSLPRPRSHDS